MRFSVYKVMYEYQNYSILKYLSINKGFWNFLVVFLLYNKYYIYLNKE